MTRVHLLLYEYSMHGIMASGSPSLSLARCVSLTSSLAPSRYRPWLTSACVWAEPFPECELSVLWSLHCRALYAKSKRVRRPCVKLSLERL
jgi:hypothetical protein